MGRWQQQGAGRDGQQMVARSMRPRTRARSPSRASGRARAVLLRRTIGAIALAAPVTLAALAVADPDRTLAQAARLLEVAGLGITEITLSGHRFATDRDIFELAGLERPSLLLGLRLAEAKERIESLGPVARAEVVRGFPGRLDIRITERTPFAVWLDGDRAVLIDRAGRTLAPVAAAAMPELPRVAGAGANITAAAMLAEIERHPGLRSALASAVRIGERRWRLVLQDGGLIELPAAAAAAALDRLAALQAQGRLGAYRSIDLRHPARTLLRNPQPSPPATVELARAGRAITDASPEVRP